MSARRYTLPTIALAAGLALSVTGCSSSDTKSGTTKTDSVNVARGANDPGSPGGEHGSEHGTEHGGAVPASDRTTTGAAEPATGEETFFAAGLSGANEVPGGNAAVGDQDGKGTALVRIKGDQVTFGIRWEGIGAPTAAHLHLGGKGGNGEVKVSFFASVLPGTANAVTGSVKVTDAALLEKIKADPASLYFNVHTGEFPGGAIRGQLVGLARPVDVNSVLKNGTLPAEATGKQEVRNAEGKKTGDPNGRADTSVRPWGNCLDWSFSWTGVAPPTLGHLHKAAAGSNGDVVAPLFDARGGLPQSVTGLAGTVEGIDPAVVERIDATPANYYTNLHTAEFPGGAVRGQLDRKVIPKSPALNLSVVAGKQIYRCTTKDGISAFTQLDVAAKLQGDLKHSFVNPTAGPPQWIAPDGSAVTGAVATRLPNGDGNIPELVLNATRTGKPGLLFATTQVLRLNTQGGVAPAGTCDPASRPTAEVPYQADYLFLG
ncbi:CHRD domain-containing protein [Embleya sp. NPDC008237]|uniref:CHRD domain-containing protein n=1 Tax=Embleya sp. NPDC008237 TaxID=3363978 RepID=UPI0036E4555F